MDRFLREPEQEKVTGLSRTTRWRLEREGKFPKSYSIGGGNAKGRLESEIQAWLDRIVDDSNDGGSGDEDEEDEEEDEENDKNRRSGQHPAAAYFYLVTIIRHSRMTDNEHYIAYR